MRLSHEQRAVSQNGNIQRNTKKLSLLFGLRALRIERGASGGMDLPVKRNMIERDTIENIHDKSVKDYYVVHEMSDRHRHRTRGHEIEYLKHQLIMSTTDYSEHAHMHIHTHTHTTLNACLLHNHTSTHNTIVLAHPRSCNINMFNDSPNLHVRLRAYSAIPPHIRPYAGAAATRSHSQARKMPFFLLPPRTMTLSLF